MPSFKLPPLALTSGDPASISAELTLKAWQDKALKGIAPFIYIGDAEHLENIAKRFKFNIQIERVTNLDNVAEIFDHKLPVLHQALKVKAVLGQPSPKNAASIIQSIQTAVTLTQQGKCRAVVTNPIAKNILYAAGFEHPGHTEYLEFLANKPNTNKPNIDETEKQESYKSVMMLACSQLKVVPITIHVPLMSILETLDTQLICKIAKIVAQDLKTYFGLEKPKMMFAGLNPHAGEAGTMGMEDIEIIKPAIDALNKQGFHAIGPMPADTMFHQRARAQYDVAFGMYHDQVLIPIKTLDFDKGVNITLGLPFIRTSPDHGTAFDIAGKNIAKPTSLIAALKMAHKMANQAGLNKAND